VEEEVFLFQGGGAYDCLPMLGSSRLFAREGEHMKTKKFSKKIVIILLITILSFGLVSSYGYAEERGIERADELSEYQNIIDQVNIEYGTDIRFLTAQESKAFGIPLPTPKTLGTLSQFEKNLRAETSAEVIRSREAEQATRDVTTQSGFHSDLIPMTPIFENGKIVGSRWDSSTGAVIVKTIKTVAPSRSVVGGYGILTGQVNNGNGYWQWYSLTSIYFYVSASYPQFYPDYTSYSLIDGSRTYSVTWGGVAVSATGTVSSATRWADYNAGSAAG
jgi:hypothetical protein